MSVLISDKSGTGEYWHCRIELKPSFQSHTPKHAHHKSSLAGAEIENVLNETLKRERGHYFDSPTL